ncbi:hypothetical protein [Corynebacterium sp.]|uniref:hypothetical protein n=1 Tax=Corynebacterium sp. TaxID=1720 RepID=UPI0026DD2EFF|nr:hypothetical protein [Corynebacterium sp.]MDO5076795.1 hypothetical protein [Corynebacterium sp.]
MILKFDPQQRVEFPTPALGSAFPIGGPRTDAALAHAAAHWLHEQAELASHTHDWRHRVAEFLACGEGIDAASARRFQCQ